MAKMIVELEWDEENLGEKWMNIDNLNIYLFSSEYTKKELLKVKEIIKSRKEQCSEGKKRN